MSVFVTLAVKSRYLKGISVLQGAGNEQAGVTQVELTEAEARAESWVRVRLRGAYDLAAWTTPSTTPTIIREAADQYGSALILWWLFQKNPEGKNRGDVLELRNSAERSIAEARNAAVLYLDSGTEVKRRSDASAVPVIRGDRPLYPPERIQDWRRQHELAAERQSYLEDVDLYTT